MTRDEMEKMLRDLERHQAEATQYLLESKRLLRKLAGDVDDQALTGTKKLIQADIDALRERMKPATRTHSEAIRTDLTVLKWMVGINVALTIATLWKVFR